MLKNLKLSTKIFLLGMGITVMFIALLAWIYPRFQSKMYEAKENQTRHVVETAYGVINYYSKQAEDGAMSEKEAKQAAMLSVKGLRYNGEEYFWINDMEPRMIMHPFTPELDGKSVADKKDPNGKRIFVEMTNVCKAEGEGKVEYMWPKPGETKPSPKISYVKMHSGWGWIIGSGVYVDDVKKEMAQIFYVFLIAVLIITGLAVSISILLTRSIALPINRIIASLTDGSDQISSASSQVAGASQSLAEGAAEQASSLEEVSSSLEEMSSMTRQNADNAEQANVLAKESRTMAETGNESTQGMIQAMSKIKESSDETQKIIKTIDEIAFQTNLLALNAAVEAARAGEAGKGFAVVAEEVRNLAQRAGEAARNTAELIEKSVTNTDLGAQTADEMANSLGAINSSISKASDLVSEIAAASKEQAMGIDQVNLAVSQMDKVTQSNAASAEESASASEELNAQAQTMNGMVVELISVVNGHKNANGTLSLNGNGNGHNGNGHLHTSHLQHGAFSLGIKSKNGNGNGHNGNGHNGNGQTTAAVLKEPVAAHPEDVIPMDNDFKEF